MERGPWKNKLAGTVKRTVIFGLLPAAALLALVAGVGSAYAAHYSEKIYPGVWIGPVNVSGLSREEAAAKLAALSQQTLNNGLTVRVNEETKTIALSSQGLTDPDASSELVRWNVDQAVNTAWQTGRSSTALAPLAPLWVGLVRQTVTLTVTLDEARLTNAITAAFPEANHPGVDAELIFTTDGEDWQVTVSPPTDGTVMQTSELFTQMKSSLEQTLTLPELKVSLAPDPAKVDETMALGLVEQAKGAVKAAPYTLTLTDAYGDHEFPLSAEMLAGALTSGISADGTVQLAFKSEFAETLKTLVAEVLTPAVDAKLVVENGLVKEFQGSRTGIDLDVEATEAALLSVLGQKNAAVALSVTTAEPAIATGEVNDLGIKEILGVGISNFSGSPTNRIKNIKNGARLLNGTLVKPDDTFSLLDTLRPFETDNGYLPELVIKGDKIEPEIGGGLCQIGTTTFRATMNSGLPIVERRNHSLVVRYYNDPRNGNPGTDATIYDPSPDFKFLNDTGHYILITTDVNMTTGQLTFTFWGSKDGRKGEYTEPVVSSWIAPGETRTIETTDLAPGETKCQHAFPGANASFTYTITRPDGTAEDQVFTSSYRALPEICLVGVAELTAPTEDDGASEPSTSEDVPPAPTSNSPAASTDASGAPIIE